MPTPPAPDPMCRTPNYPSPKNHGSTEKQGPDGSDLNDQQPQTQPSDPNTMKKRGRPFGFEDKSPPKGHKPKPRQPHIPAEKKKRGRAHRSKSSGPR